MTHADTTTRAGALYAYVAPLLSARGVSAVELARVVRPTMDRWEAWGAVRDLPGVAMRQAIRALHKAGVPVADEAPR